MKFPFWRRGEPNSSTERTLFIATRAGWFLAVVPEPDHPLRAYLLQLEDEGYADPSEQGHLIAWPKLYSLLGDETHTDSWDLLQLPCPLAVRPRLISQGTPADNGFRIAVDQWLDTDGNVLDLDRTGAVVSADQVQRLLPQATFELLVQMELLAEHGAQWGADRRLLQMGRIQQLARVADARLDRYLDQSPVVVADSLGLQLKEASVAGESSLEIIPEVENAPDGWLEHFDSYVSARGRYDVSEAGKGVTHVVLPDNVKSVASTIKALPARRLVGKQAEAFLSSPYQILGEAAEAVISPERIAVAKQNAGIIDWELDLQHGEADGHWDAVLIDPTGGCENEFIGTYTEDQFASLVESASDANSIGLVRWKGHRISMSGVTQESLGRLRQAKFVAAVGSALATEALFDLSQYSDRVVGFDGTPIIVPKVQGGSAGPDWIEGCADYARVDPGTGETRKGALSPDDVAELEKRVVEAERAGEPTVRVPNADTDISTAEGRAWVQAIASASSRKDDGALPIPKNPEPASKLSLRILHNIEALEYRSENVRRKAGDCVYEAPAALRPEVALKAHQVEGVAWMQDSYRLRAEGMRGILLADDMGLGKTLQALTLMAWYRQTSVSPRPCLIVAPVSLLENWKAEIEKFLDGRQGQTITLYGEHLSRHRLTSGELGPELRELGVKKALNPGFARDAAFVLTTYETLRDFQISMAREKWGVFVCDEAQRIKNPVAMVTRAAKAMQADFKIACTGTPVENSLSDLWCLFDFFQPGLLDSLASFTKLFRQSIERREDGHEVHVEVLRSQIDPWVLRRMKSEVADLKPKIEEVCKLPMSDRQRSLYDSAARHYRQAVDGSGAGGVAALALLHRLRRICANPLAAEGEGADLVSLDEHLRHSPKLAWLEMKLREIKGRGEKAIVFSEFKDIQRLCQRVIASRLGYQASIVNGSTGVQAGSDDSRQSIIDAFQRKPGFGVIVLSTTAVGFGVNIQAANHVIHFTRPWNPAKEDQATDRAYRIGQEREVFVYYPTVTGDGFESFEQRVASILESKRIISSDMLASEYAVTHEDFSGIG